MAGREGAEVGWVGKAQEFALYSKGNGKSLKAMLLSKPSEEDFSGCCVDRELVDGRLGSGKCLDGGAGRGGWHKGGGPDQGHHKGQREGL